MLSNIETFRTSRQSDLCLKHLTQELYGVNFFLEKNYPHWKLFTLNTLLDLRSLAFVKERVMALKQMIDKKTHSCLSYLILSSFFLGQILSAAPLKIVPSGTKFVSDRDKPSAFFECL